MLFFDFVNIRVIIQSINQHLGAGLSGLTSHISPAEPQSPSEDKSEDKNEPPAPSSGLAAVLNHDSKKPVESHKEEEQTDNEDYKENNENKDKPGKNAGLSSINTSYKPTVVHPKGMFI